MATVLTIGTLLRARIWASNAEQASVNNMGYLVVGLTGAPTFDTDVARSLDALMAPIYKPTMTTNSHYNGVQVTWPTTTPRPATVFVNTNFGPGTQAPPDLPRQVCGVVGFQTNLAGRRYRGRAYFPFPASSMDSGDGAPSAAYVAYLTSWRGALVGLTSVPNAGATGTAQLSPVIIHEPGKTDVPPPTPIIASTSSTRWGTQRRRGSYGRANSSPI